MDSKVHKDGEKKGMVKLQMAVADPKEGERVYLKLLAKIYNLYIYIYIFLNNKENPICTIKLMYNFK